MISIIKIQHEYNLVCHDLKEKFPHYAKTIRAVYLSTNGSKKTVFGTYNRIHHKVTIYPHMYVSDDIVKLRDTIRHELAHAVNHKQLGGRGHDRSWKSVARQFGADPRATHKVSRAVYDSIDYKYRLMFGDEFIRGYHRRPKWAGRVKSIRLPTRPETDGKLILVQMR
jgi:predicted SprT family Zn-dependent metalloprotease